MRQNESKGKKKHVVRNILLVLIGAIVLLAGIGAGVGLSRRASQASVYINSSSVRMIEDTAGQGIGQVRVSTLMMPEGICATRASYTFSGSVCLNYKGKGTKGIAVMKDDGTGFKTLCQGSTGKRLLPFADNTRILLGGQVLECPKGTTLDTCPENSAAIYDIVFPEEFTKDSKVVSIWSEVIIAPDNVHFAWTMLRKDCGAAVAIGELRRDGGVYRVENAAICSRMNVYSEDPDHPGYLLSKQVIGGEVKQFVHGGGAVSLVGADATGVAQSVVMDIATGDYTMVTNTPAYDETTIFSPDERYGVTMSTRFSDRTSLAVLGIVPRPIGDVMQNMTSTIYMYSVTGVRNEREGNIGPVLIQIERSMNEDHYMGLCLADPDSNWVYHSPMSWHPDGNKVMWMEGQRTGGGVRVQIAELSGIAPEEPVKAAEVPAIGDYADQDPLVKDVDGLIAGKFSGTAHLVKKTGFLQRKTVEVTYDHYSDDGIHFYDGTEASSGSIVTGMTYQANLTVTDGEGTEVGSIHGELVFGAAYKLSTIFTGSTSPQLNAARSHIDAAWYNTKISQITAKEQ